MLAANAAADLVILYDSGRSWPIERYLDPLLRHGPKPYRPQSVPIGPLPGPPDLTTLLPIRSPGLTPGRVTPREFELPIPVAFFMIGSDDASLHWLKNHRETLLSLGGVGLLVEASSEKDLEAVAAAAGGLPITPSSGEDIARALGVKHYPVAISEGRLWQ